MSLLKIKVTPFLLFWVSCLWVCIGGGFANKSTNDSLVKIRDGKIKEGYLKARVEGGKVKNGALIKIKSITLLIKGEESEIFTLTAYQGQVASLKTLKGIEHKIEKEMLNLGFPFFNYQLDFKEGEGVSGVALLIKMNTESGYKFGRIQYKGTRTKRSVLARLSLIEVGDTYKPDLSKLAREKLARTGYYQYVEEGTLFRDSIKMFLYPTFLMEDAKGNSITGLLGFSNEEEGSENKELTGFFDISLKNIMGTARDLDFHFSRENATAIDFVYEEPWLLKLPIGGIVNFNLYQEDSVYEETNKGLKLFQDYDYYSRYLLSYQSQSNWVLEVVDDSTWKRITSTALFTSLQLIYDYRNNALYTNKGGVLDVEVTGVRRNAREGVQYLLQNKVRWEGWKKWGRTHWLFHYKWASSIVYPFERSLENRGNLFSVGGANSIRGYRENEFLTNLFVYQNIELLYLISPKNRLMAFIDPALINKNEGDIYWRKIMGYGVGLELGSKDWIFGLSYALNPYRSFGEGLLHFKVVNRF